jgi:hypothetical protein
MKSFTPILMPPFGYNQVRQPGGDFQQLIRSKFSLGL